MGALINIERMVQEINQAAEREVNVTERIQSQKKVLQIVEEMIKTLTQVSCLIKQDLEK